MKLIQRLIGLIGHQPTPTRPARHPRQRRRQAGVRGRSHTCHRPHRPSVRRRPLHWQVAYHGTSLASAQAILQRGFYAGKGMACGSGIYLASDVQTASVYGNYHLKCLVDMRRSSQWTPQLQSQFTAWCQQCGAAADAAAQSSFLLSLGIRVLVVGNVLVVLRTAPLNPAAVQYKDSRIKIISVHRSSDGVRVRV